MYIIDKNKDYYDYHSHYYGVDKQIVYDRRNSTVETNEQLINMAEIHGRVTKPDAVKYLLLEIGYTQYLVRLYDFIMTQDSLLGLTAVDCNMKLVNTFNDFTHRFTTPISIRCVHLYSYWKFERVSTDFRNRVEKGKYEEVLHRIYDNAIENPILSNTKIAGLIDGEVIWKELQNYISSLNNDVDCSTPMTDVEKAEIHGFDKKTSFRNPIK